MACSSMTWSSRATATHALPGAMRRRGRQWRMSRSGSVSGRTFQSADYSILRKRTLHNVAHIRREVGTCRDAPQCCLREGAAASFERAPALERGEKPRGELRVSAIERQYCVDDEVIARTIGAVEFLRIGKSEGVDQRAH